MASSELAKVLSWFRNRVLAAPRKPGGERYTEELVNSFRLATDGQGEYVESTLCSKSGWRTDSVRWPTYFHRLCKRLPSIGPYADGRTLKITHLASTPRFEFELVRSTVPLMVTVDPTYDAVQDIIRKRRTAQHAVMIQHSGMTTLGLRRLLLGMGAKVELYVQDPDAACNRAQRGKIAFVIGDMVNIHRDDIEDSTGSLDVYYYRAPAALRAVLIDDEVLAVGWYTYHQEGETLSREEGVNIQGDKRPILVVSKGSSEFEQLVLMFNRVLDNIRRYAVPAASTSSIAGSSAIHGVMARGVKGRKRKPK